MRYLALCTDYDGTIARHGVVDLPTIDALARLRESGRKLIMVTGRELAELIPNAELRTMPGCGHFTFINNPELFRDTIRSFIDRTPHSDRTRPLVGTAPVIASAT